MAAAEEELGELHSLLCKVMKQQLTLTDEDGRVNAAVLGHVARFLKDNGIEAAAEYSKELQELSEEFPFDDNVVKFGTK